MCLLTSLFKNNVDDTKVLAFDFKRELRSIISDKLGKDVRIYTVGRNDKIPFCWNPLIPPSEEINPNNWMEQVLDILSKAFYIGDGAMDVLKRGISACYREWGVYSGKVNRYPTFKDVYKKVMAMQLKGRQREWAASAQRVLRSLSFGELGKALNTPVSVPFQAILKEHVIFELDSLSASKRAFLTAAILLWVYNFELEKYSKGERPKGLKRLVIIDEAHNVFPKHEGKETTMETMLRQARYLGCGIILSDQVPSEMSPVAMCNTFIHINLNQKNKADINVAASNLLLDQEQKEYLGHIKLGEAIVRIAGRYTHPFLISIPAIEIKEQKVTDEMVCKHMESMVTHDWNSAYLRLNSPKFKEVTHIPDEYKELLSDEEKLFLKDIITHKYIPISKRYKYLNIGIRKGNKIKNLLLEKGLIETEEIIMKTGRVLLTKLSKTGENLMKKEGYDLNKLNGKAGLEHEYWRHKIIEYLKKMNYKINNEVQINGEADIIGELNGIKICLEIETGKSGYEHPIDNIKKDQKAGFDRIISVATNRNTLENLQKNLKEIGLDNNKIKVVLADDFAI
jgi:hypothetical protein